MKEKHLEFIQNVITRMNSNSFFIKGWTITLVSALFALAAIDSNLKFVLVSYIVIPVFWILDGFFIAVERRYRDLYAEVAEKTENNIDFKMDTSKFKKGNRTWI
jgi:4-amino-4-deoxy-L-arabinose transferase-like glycosyltransferase